MDDERGGGLKELDIFLSILFFLGLDWSGSDWSGSDWVSTMMCV